MYFEDVNRSKIDRVSPATRYFTLRLSLTLRTYRSYAQYREPRFLPFKKYLVTKFYFFQFYSTCQVIRAISAVFSAKNTLHRLILSLSCMMKGASHSSLEHWAILSEILENCYT